MKVDGYANNLCLGVAHPDINVAERVWNMADKRTWFVHGGPTTTMSYMAGKRISTPPFDTDDVVAFEVDVDAGTIDFFKNGDPMCPTQSGGRGLCVSWFVCRAHLRP